MYLQSTLSQNLFWTGFYISIPRSYDFQDEEIYTSDFKKRFCPNVVSSISYCSHLNKTTTYEDPRKWLPIDPEDIPEPRVVDLTRDHELGFGFVAGSEKPVIVRYILPFFPYICSRTGWYHTAASISQYSGQCNFVIARIFFPYS